MSVEAHRTNTILSPDQSRVLLRAFTHGDSQRTSGIIARVLALSEEAVNLLMEELSADFSQRHKDIRERYRGRFEQMREQVPGAAGLSEQRRELIGAHFLAEYSLESAALFNPSIVPHPNQSDLPPGAMRFILSLRATGEGHISSITFRTGIIHRNHRIEITVPTGFLTEPQQIPNSVYEKPLFGRKLAELGLGGDFVDQVMEELDDPFTMEHLQASVEKAKSLSPDGMTAQNDTVGRSILMLARSNYKVRFLEDQPLCARIIFPATPSQSNGIEDARFVRFKEDDGSSTYYATFTAYDGTVVMPELVSTSDFLHFRFNTLNGPSAVNKGMALFPRKIGGLYAMLGRQDNESIHLMLSDNIHFWNESRVLLKPAFPWEGVQVGNCGSPIETDAGWLVLSHGVGPMRKYCIGAFLLDLEDPSKVIGRLREPLLKPNRKEREGYVPNVVYTCGAIVHNDVLIIPYGLADHATGFATTPLAELLTALLRGGDTS